MLQLWDRVIAYDSLLPIPVLAAAVFVFRFQTIFARVTRHTPHVTRQSRSKAILDSSNAEMINEVFEDLTRIRFVLQPAHTHTHTHSLTHTHTHTHTSGCDSLMRCRFVPLMQWFIFGDSAVPSM